MSRAFVREDVDVPERSTRRLSASGLPPGALNYITESGVFRLRERLAELKKEGEDDAEISELEDVLDTATVVKPATLSDTVVFGVSVTLRSDQGEIKACRIVGVDEVQLDPHGVSWVSTMGKTLLGAKVGQRITLDSQRAPKWTIIGIEMIRIEGRL